MQIAGIGAWGTDPFINQQSLDVSGRPTATTTPSGSGEMETTASSPASSSTSLPQLMTGDQVRNLLNSQGMMSLHAFSITAEFKPDGAGGYQAVSNVPENWTEKMQGILAFDQQIGNRDFVRQDASILNLLEKA